MAFRVISSLLRMSKRTIVHLPNVHRSGRANELPPKMLDASLILKNRNLPDLPSSKKPKDLGILNAVRDEKHATAVKAKAGIEKAVRAKFLQHEKNAGAHKVKVSQKQESEVEQVKSETRFYPYADGFGYFEK